ncbi:MULTISPECIES: hypothetical protein [Streptosporangium]|uniref:DUF3060 domain-containing protein n=1 Tax=Streptosporangium brasiliense TaxID=47480 RepID=A0ABT9RKB1_9ACTN|nr:hypothetical protein [Streptosporangium brasiliense]MDP9869742.1 hypothetical protein [Streptosporangium brasiliense]
MRTRSPVPAGAGRVRSAAVVVAVLLAGCDPGGAPAPWTAAAPGSAALAPGTVRDSPASPRASDGTDLAACQDADCEVEVRPGDRLRIDAGFGVDEITVRSLGGEEIRLGLRGSSGDLHIEGESVSVEDDCTDGRCRSVGELSLATGDQGRINGVRLRLAGLASGRAVLVLSPHIRAVP